MFTFTLLCYYVSFPPLPFSPHFTRKFVSINTTWKMEKFLQFQSKFLNTWTWRTKVKTFYIPRTFSRETGLLFIFGLVCVCSRWEKPRCSSLPVSHFTTDVLTSLFVHLGPSVLNDLVYGYSSLETSLITVPSFWTWHLLFNHLGVSPVSTLNFEVSLGDYPHEGVIIP